jgi:hypothetical protein
MSAGYIQLAAIGQQDAYLTGEPQVTYFSGVYRRHTPFVLEAYDIPFLDQQVGYGQNNICRIPPKGDLVRGLTLKLTLPPLNNPGDDWTWPTAPAIDTNQPYIRIVKPATGGPDVTLTATLLVPSYSTNNLSKWLTTRFAPYIEYNSALNLFVFSNCVSVEVLNSSAPLAPGIFFSMDPKAYTSINPASGNLVYTVNSTSNLQANSISPSNVLANCISSVTRLGDFTLEQAGWIKSIGTLPPDPKKGFFAYLNQPLNISGRQFLNFSSTSGTGAFWNVVDPTPKYTITSGGRIKFGSIGLYAIKAGFELGAGSVQTLSFGSSRTESTEGGGPVNPNFETTYTFRVSPDPSMPAVIPISVKSTANTYYFYITSTGSQLQANSHLSISPVDEFYQLNSPIVMNANPCKLQLSGNVVTTGAYTILLTPDSNINFVNEGEYLMTGVVYLNSGYVSDMKLWESANLIYTYDMSVQGRDPTFAFSMPISVSNPSANYYATIATTTTTTVLANTYFVLNKISSPLPDSNVLPDNGLTFRSSASTLTAPLRLASDFAISGNSNLISYTNSGLQFSSNGTYMLTGAVCTKDKVTSLTFGSRQYTVSLGILPPYTFQVPLIVTDTSLTYPISVTTDGSSASPNIFSNTFVSVYPVTLPIIDPAAQIFSYYDSVGTWAIKSADLKIGGQTIQSLTGEYIELWNDLHVPYENQSGLQVLTGKNDTQTTINPPGRTYFVNLPFYFYGNPSLYLPLVALGRHDVEVHVTFRNFNELTEIQVSNPSLGATIIVDYVYLSDPEINWFQRAQLDYVITQCQYQTISLLPNFENAVFNLDLKNPVRELFFVVQPTNQPPYDYSNNAVLSFGLSFNGQEVFTPDTTDRIYAGDIEPFNHYPNFPQRKFFMYAFTGNPKSPKPRGQINFSRIKQVLLTLNCGGQSYLPEKELRMLAVNYNILRIADGLGGLRFNT